MNKDTMRALIDREEGAGFSKNISLEGYNFFRGNSFVSFKIQKIEGFRIINIHYIYSDKYEDLVSLLAYCCNFWMNLNIKFIYYKEKEKNPYARDYLERIGFKVSFGNPSDWKNEFKCIKGENPCNCKTVEAYV